MALTEEEKLKTIYYEILSYRIVGENGDYPERYTTFSAIMKLPMSVDEFGNRRTIPDLVRLGLIEIEATRDYYGFVNLSGSNVKLIEACDEFVRKLVIKQMHELHDHEEAHTITDGFIESIISDVKKDIRVKNLDCELFTYRVFDDYGITVARYVTAHNILGIPSSVKLTSRDRRRMRMLMECDYIKKEKSYDFNGMVNISVCDYYFLSKTGKDGVVLYGENSGGILLEANEKIAEIQLSLVTSYQRLTPSDENVTEICLKEVDNAPLEEKKNMSYSVYVSVNCDKMYSSFGGAAYVIENKDKIVYSQNFSNTSTTFHRLELTAIIEAVKLCPLGAFVTIYTNNVYVYNMLRRDSCPEKNGDLYMQFDECSKRTANVWLRLRKGHEWSEYSERAYRLAKEAHDELCYNTDIRNCVPY